MREIDVIYVAIILMVTSSCNRQQEIFNRTVGCYRIDLLQTDLGPYKMDSPNYERLTIQFRPDSTFSINMQVPFILDTSGQWISSIGGIDDWSWLSFSSWKSNPTVNSGNQFTEVYGADSILYLNGTAYKREAKGGIQKIFFKKFSCK